MSRASFPFFIVKIKGLSAWPELVPEKTYFATSLLRPRVGNFIVFRNPKTPDQFMVKKIEAIKDDGYSVKGAVSWSTSSKELGLIHEQFLLGTVLL